MWREENVICHYISVICISASRCCFFPDVVLSFSFFSFFWSMMERWQPIWSYPNVSSFSFLFIPSILFLSFAVKVVLMTGKVSRWKTKLNKCALVHLLFFFSPFFPSMFLFLFINLFWLWIEGWQASEPSPNVPSSFCLYIHLSLHLLFFSIFPLHAVLIPTYFFLCLRMEGWQMSRLKDKLITLTCPPPCPPPPNNDPHSFFFLIWSRMEAWQVKWACGKLKTWHWHVSSFSSSSFFPPFPPHLYPLFYPSIPTPPVWPPPPVLFLSFPPWCPSSPRPDPLLHSYSNPLSVLPFWKRTKRKRGMKIWIDTATKRVYVPPLIW